MTREELRGKQTPGTWVWYKRDDMPSKWNGITAHDGEHEHVALTHESAGRGEWNAWVKVSDADAALIAEAGTVANETGYWPKDLVERVKELEEVLSVAMKSLNTYGPHPIIDGMYRVILNKKP